MRKMNNTSLNIKFHLPMALVLSSFLITTLAANAQHTAISTLLPAGYHAEEALTWCGPATGQMVVAGYPMSGCTVAQADMDMSIQAHKVEVNWDTDPAGLRGALMEQCPLPAGHIWAVFNNVDATAIMWAAAHYMTTNQYPVAALLGTTAHNSDAQHQEHWVVITAIVTDQDPTKQNTVNLEFVQFVDPQPDPSGDPTKPQVFYVSAATWYADFAAVIKPSAYNGKFVAVIEPPATTGHAVSNNTLPVTGRIIAATAAERAALAAVHNLKLAETQDFREFANAKPLRPMLVNATHGGYYLVPFSTGEKTHSLAVIVNAYNGEFQAAGHFAPRVLLEQNDAAERVRAALGLKQPLRPGKFTAELVSADVETRFTPDWKITTGYQSLTVGQRGTVREFRPK